MFAIFIAACGGGAGTIGLATGAALFTSAPSAVTVPVGASASYNIGGGTPIYHASSSTPSVATVSIAANGTTLIIVGVASGASQISISDAVGAIVNIAVTVGTGTGGTGAGTALFITSASTATIAVGATNTFTVGGGTAPYTLSSSNTSVATATIFGNTIAVTGAAAGTALVLVFDATGNSVGVTFTVGAGGSGTALYTTSGSAITLALGVTNSYTVGGGTAPYAVSSSNNGVATASIAGAKLSIDSVATGAAQILIFDATGASVSITTTVGSGAAAVPLYVTSASAVTIQIGSVNTYTVGGGAAPYSVSSSNTGVATASIAGAVLTVNGVTAGATQVLVFDSTGASVTIAVTIASHGSSIALYTTAPSNISVAVGGTGTYTIGGGTAPYTASSGNPSAASANIAGAVLSIGGLSAGTALVQVFDATGASVSSDVTVTQASSPVISVQPNGATGNVGDILQFLFTGGTPAYSATVTDPSIATLSAITTNATGGSFSATLVNAGSTNVTIVDSTGQTQSFTLTAAQTSASLRLSPSALLISEDDTNSIGFNIYGGTGPYTAFTGNQILFTVSTGGSTLTAALGSSGNRCVTPIDSSGNYVPSGAVPVTITVVDSLGASATAIVTIQDNGVGNAGGFVAPGPHCD